MFCRTTRLVGSLCVILAGCTSSTAIELQRTRNVALIPTLGGAVYAVQAGSDTQIVAAATWERISEFGVQSSHAGSTFVTSFESYSDRSLRRIALPSGTEVQRVTLAGVESSTADFGQVSLGFGSPFAVDDGLQTLAFALSSANRTPGVALVDAASNRVKAFAAPFAANAVAFGQWRGLSVLFVGGSRSTTLPSRATVYMLSRTSGDVVDSVDVSSPSFQPGGGLSQIIAIPALQSFVAYASGGVTSCAGLPAGTTCRSARIPSSSGSMWYRDGDTNIVVNDVGSSEDEGTGAIYTVALDASSVATHVLPTVAGRPCVTRGVAAFADGTGWIVTAGSAPGYAQYPAQAARVFIVSSVTGNIVASLALPALPLRPLAF